MKGLIALDIDGTVTDEIHHVPVAVIDFLRELHALEWQIMFITGRTFSFSHSTLQGMNFPYFLAVQNGADILEMPQQRLISQSYLTQPAIALIDQIYTEEKEDFLVYAGYAKGDFCYYRPDRFSKEMLAYLDKIKPLAREPWKAVQNFDLPELDQFPLIKCLGAKSTMQKIHAALTRELPSVHATLIRDPIGEELWLNLVTKHNATKGEALLRAAETLKITGPLIAAGDDLNDLSMLEKADIRIVMETAPREMFAHADIVAPAAAKCGIIQALQQAVRG